MSNSSAVRLIIEPKVRSIGELDVRRALPDARQRRVGPFVFFDHFGPVDFAPGSGVNVRPHPHIGLATITWLFAGTIVHRDSLGFVQPIEPGAVNWMTAGRGIVHSERSPPEQVQEGSHVHGIQTWVALPVEAEECEPRFEHYPAGQIPAETRDGVRLCVAVGEIAGLRSPVRPESETVLAQVDLEADSRWIVPAGFDELAIYVVDGTIECAGDIVPASSMAILDSGNATELVAREASRMILIGGASLPGKRTVWWNFVSSSRDRIEKAKQDWKEGRFDPVPGEHDSIPLPSD